MRGAGQENPPLCPVLRCNYSVWPACRVSVVVWTVYVEGANEARRTLFRRTVDCLCLLGAILFST
eukprot:3700082-Pyramimonas_sp.AAC.1